MKEYNGYLMFIFFRVEFCLENLIYFVVMGVLYLRISIRRGLSDILWMGVMILGFGICFLFGFL